MRRILHWGAIILTILLMLALLVFYALITGIAFTPFLSALEQVASHKSHCQISLGKIRLNLKGEVLVSAISIKYKDLPRVFVPEARIEPRWSAILRRQFILDRARIATGHVDLAAPQSKINFSGQYDGKTGTVEAAMTVFIASLRKEFGTMDGTITADGRLSGPWRSPQLSVRARAENLQYKDMNFTDAKISWNGNIQHGQLRVDARMKNGASFRGNGPAQRNADGVSWRWNELRARTPQRHEWAAVPGGEVEISSAGVIDVRRLRVADKGGAITVQKLSYQNDSFDVKVVADHFNLDIDTRATGVIDGMIQLRGPVDNPKGNFDLQLSSVAINRLPLMNIRSDGEVKDAQISIRHGVLVGHALPPVAFHGTVPWAWVIQTASKEEMDIAVSAQSELNDIETMPGGTIRLDGRIFGPAHGIQTEGILSANLPVFQMPAYGIDAHDARVDIELKNQHLLIRAAEATVGKGKLSVSGESDLPALNYTLRGENITMQARRKFDLKADLQLALTGSTTAPFLTGDVHVSQATYEENKKKKEVDASEPPPAMLHAWDLLRVEVNANWNNNVWYRDGLTKIETEGKLELFKDRGERDLHWRGPVTLLRGSYDAYGRDFIIKSGDLNFNGDIELDPRLNIQATHKMKDAVVDLDVAGTASKPELHFRSTPPMAEQDILSMLALGTAPGKSASGSGADSRTTQATELAADVVSDYLTRELRTTGMNVLDLDVIRVSPTDKGKEWTVGRYWGSKLFLSYSYNPDNAASQVLKAEYAVTPKWFLVGQSGSQADNYLDVNFRLPVGKSRKKAPR